MRVLVFCGLTFAAAQAAACDLEEMASIYPSMIEDAEAYRAELADCAAQSDVTTSPALGRAIVRDNNLAVEVLLEAGADPNHFEPGDYPLLSSAAIGENATAVILLLAAGADVNGAQGDYPVPLHTAVFNDDVASVRALLSAGADPTQAATYSESMMELALSSDADSGEVVAALIKAGADPNRLIDGRDHPLHRAVTEGELGVIRALVAAGVDVDVPDEIDRAPLYWAAIWDRHQPALEVLLELGADPNRNDAEALLATERENNAEAVRALIAAGAVRSVEGWTSSIIGAIVMENYHSLEMILEDGIDPALGRQLLIDLRCEPQAGMLLIDAGADISGLAQEIDSQATDEGQTSWLSVCANMGDDGAAYMAALGYAP